VGAGAVSFAVRSSVLVLYEAPYQGERSPGCCRWCGDPIVLANPSDYRRRRRTIHYGDGFEVSALRCRAAYLRSFTWDARRAVRWRERAAHGVVACVDCGTVCEGVNEMSGEGAVSWEADHDVPLEDGGAHELANLRCRCVPCHAAKTAREARERAARRRASRTRLAS
jgi:5-methylcytosine-specific restriction endonuclease McrA